MATDAFAPDASSALLNIATARAYRQGARAANTRRAYASDWAQFGLDPLPAQPEAVATHLAVRARAGNAPSTITRHLAAIGWQHRHMGAPPPQARDTRMVIADMLAGIRREQRARPPGKNAPISAADCARMIACAQGEGTRSTRDRAVLAVGLAAALRRSELVALQLADLTLVPQGLALRIRASKTDQEGAGAVITIPAGKVLTRSSTSTPGCGCAAARPAHCSPALARPPGSIRQRSPGTRCAPGSSPRRRAPALHWPKCGRSRGRSRSMC